MAPSKKKKVAAKTPAKKKIAPKVKASAKKVAAKAKAPTKTAAKTSAAKKSKMAPKKSSTKAKVKKVAKAVAAVLAPAALTAIAVKSASSKIKAKAKSMVDYASLMTPLDDRILVITEPAAEVTTGGIIIPGTVDERPQRGRVVAVGRGRRNKKGKLRPLEVTVGETIVFAEAAGSKITVAGAELLIIREDEILGVVG